MSWKSDIIAAHLAVSQFVKVNHYQALKKGDRYFVWQEEDANDLIAEGSRAERAVRGTTDLFTKTEDDPWKDAFEASLTAAGIAWQWLSTQFEPDTGYIHFEWSWEVLAKAATPEPDPEPEPEPEPETEDESEEDPHGGV